MLPRTGDLLGRKYRLGEELGRGAMGIVYEARHETLEQRVAIKILRRSEVDDEERAVRRFEREARIVANLDSPHVVKVIDVDRTDEGVPYLVMELLEGRDLAAEVDARADVPIGTFDAVRWMVQVCEAMCVAHDAGVVHRDLKLSNVFLTTTGTVKVLDFGVAAFRPGDPERSTTMNVAGTPRYMAPEQLLGEPPNPSSDIWAIGVMLYRTLGGRFPYDAPTMAGQMLAMMEGCAALDAIAPRVPRPLAEIVGRALGHTLDKRWGSARELSHALAPFSTTTRVEAEVKPTAEAVKAPIVRPRRAAGLWLFALVVGATIVGLGARALRESTAEPASAVAPPIDAAVSASAPPPAAISVVVPTPSAPAHTAPPPAPRPRASIPSAPPAHQRAVPSQSASPDDGFPPHL